MFKLYLSKLLLQFSEKLTKNLQKKKTIKVKSTKHSTSEVGLKVNNTIQRFIFSLSKLLLLLSRKLTKNQKTNLKIPKVVKILLQRSKAKL